LRICTSKRNGLVLCQGGFLDKCLGLGTKQQEIGDRHQSPYLIHNRDFQFFNAEFDGAFFVWDEDIDSFAFDGTANVCGDGRTETFYVDFRSEWDDFRVNGDDFFRWMFS
jgi:hypothetical protein